MIKAKSKSKFTRIPHNKGQINKQKRQSSKVIEKRTISKCKSDHNHSKKNKINKNTQFSYEEKTNKNRNNVIPKNNQSKRIQRASSYQNIRKDDYIKKNSINSSPSKVKNSEKKTYILNNVKNKKPLILNPSFERSSGYNSLTSFQRNSQKTIKNSTFWNDTINLDKTLSKTSNLTKKKRSPTIKSFNLSLTKQSSKFSKQNICEDKHSKQNPDILSMKMASLLNQDLRQKYFSKWIQQNVNSVNHSVEQLKAQINKHQKQKLQLIRNKYDTIIKQLSFYTVKQQADLKKANNMPQNKALPKCEISRIQTILSDGYKKNSENQIKQSEQSSFHINNTALLNFNIQNTNEEQNNFFQQVSQNQLQQKASCSSNQHWDSYLQIPCSQTLKNKTKCLGLNLNLNSIKKDNPSIKQYHQQFMDNQDYFSQSWKREILKEKNRNL